MSSSPRVRQVAAGIHEVFLPLPTRPSIVNVWLIDGGSEWALVDTGMRTEDSLGALDEALNLLGLSAASIRKIICTHHHPDHFGSSGPLAEKWDAEVFIHPLEVERVETFLPGPRSEKAVDFFRRNGIPLERFTNVPRPGEYWKGLYKPVHVSHPIDDGDVLRVGDRRMRAVWTPGHAPGHCCFYFPDEKALIVGDHLLPKISPHVGIYPTGPRNPLGDYLDSLEKVGKLDVQLVLPAHGGVFSDHRRRVDQLTHHHEYRMLSAVDSVRARPLTAYEVAREMFEFDASAPVQVQFPATFEALAHLELLVQRGDIARHETDDSIRYGSS